MRNWLKNVREKANRTQKDVALNAGMSLTYYSYIESGERGRKLPVPTAQRIASVLNFDWRRFYEDDFQMERKQK